MLLTWASISKTCSSVGRHSVSSSEVSVCSCSKNIISSEISAANFLVIYNDPPWLPGPCHVASFNDAIMLQVSIRGAGSIPSSSDSGGSINSGGFYSLSVTGFLFAASNRWSSFISSRASLSCSTVKVGVGGVAGFAVFFFSAGMLWGKTGFGFGFG